MTAFGWVCATFAVGEELEDFVGAVVDEVRRPTTSRVRFRVWFCVGVPSTVVASLGRFPALIAVAFCSLNSASVDVECADAVCEYVVGDGAV